MEARSFKIHNAITAIQRLDQRYGKDTTGSTILTCQLTCNFSFVICQKNILSNFT